MKLVIDSKNVSSGSSLCLKVAGFSVEISDISESKQIVIIEEDGKVSIEAFPCQAVSEASLEEIAKAEEAEPLYKAVSEVQDISTDLLFPKLALLRTQIAKEEKLPPYIVFHDTSLKDMVSKLPVDLEAMKNISGVGQVKLEKYGKRFVDVIIEYLKDYPF
ncbi:MAG: hypothetical protein C0412_13520 [Flavobacterium sp.]|nr:hypothetical protein [Flavobacterium sp.]